MLPEAKDLRDYIVTGIAPPSITAEAWLNWEVAAKVLKASGRGKTHIEIVIPEEVWESRVLEILAEKGYITEQFGNTRVYKVMWDE